MTIRILSLKEGADVELAAACDADCDTDTDHACDCYSGNG